MNGTQISKTPTLCVYGLLYEMSVHMRSTLPHLGCCIGLLERERNQLLQVSLAAMNAIINVDCYLGGGEYTILSLA